MKREVCELTLFSSKRRIACCIMKLNFVTFHKQNCKHKKIHTVFVKSICIEMKL